MTVKKKNAQGVIKDIKQQTRKLFNGEEKIRIVIEGMRGEDTVASIRSFRKYLIGTIALTLLTFDSFFVNGIEPTIENKAHIILINIDDMGWRDFGFMGSEYYETPNIDLLAQAKE